MWDFDGVLADSQQHTILALQKTFYHHGLSIPSSEEILELNGLTAPEMRDALIKKRVGGVPLELSQSVENTRRRISEHTWDDISLYEGAIEALEYVAQICSQGIVSSRGNQSLQYLLQKHGISHYFSSVIGREDVKNHKPHPEPLLKCAQTLDVKPCRSLYIGDTEHDAKAAYHANTNFVRLKGENINELKYWV